MSKYTRKILITAYQTVIALKFYYFLFIENHKLYVVCDKRHV